MFEIQQDQSQDVQPPNVLKYLVTIKRVDFQWVTAHI